MAIDRFSIRVQAVVRIFDGFSYMPVKKSYMRFCCDSSLKILPKEDGYFVVVGNERSGIIHIESAFFKDISVDISDAEPNIPLNLWAEPKRGYNIAENILWIETLAGPDEKLYAFEHKTEPVLRLLEDSKGNDLSLKIYQERKMFLNGADMLIYTKDDLNSAEIVKIDCVENERCALLRPLKNEHKKIKTGIYRLATATSDNSGKCSIAVAKREDKAKYIIFNSKGEKIDEITV